MEAAPLVPAPAPAPVPAAAEPTPEPVAAPAAGAGGGAGATGDPEVLDAQYHALLWNHLDVATSKADDGLHNLELLSKFVGKRINAEKETASRLLEMCQASKWAAWGQRDELLDVLRESGSMNETWSLLVDKTKETCRAHQESAERLSDEAQEPLEHFLRSGRPRFVRQGGAGPALLLRPSPALSPFHNLHWIRASNRAAAEQSNPSRNHLGLSNLLE